jgi:PHP family Zn ribbon phosphoesterase
VEAIERPEGFFVFRGVEISTGQGHLLAYGLKDDSWNRWSKNLNLNAAEVIEAVHDCGGICVPAHPFRGWDSFGEEVYRIQGLDALETHNGCSSEEANRKAVQAALLRKLPSLGGSDCHTKDQVGRAYTVFKNHVHTMIELVEEIKRGNCEGVML